jgi:competence ComEA-like helix-hairpin-helix protein
MKKLVILIFTLFFISVISSLCEEGQIDINFATKEELDDLDGIGPVKAEGIINYGTFESVDELIKVYGIGEATLGKIKSQGLACVNEESGDIEENEEKDEVENEEKEKEQKIVYDEKIEKKDIKLSTIKLNTALHENE